MVTSISAIALPGRKDSQSKGPLDFENLAAFKDQIFGGAFLLHTVYLFFLYPKMAPEVQHLGA